MAFLKYLVPALAVASLAAADSDCSGKKTVQNQGDASALSSCSKLDGDVIIDPKVRDGLTFDGIEEITGSFSAVGCDNLTSLAASLLATIGDTFELSGDTKLTDLEMGSLTEVGKIDFEALPVLQQLSFAKGVSKAKTVRITNTNLNSLDGINLESVGDMEISNNRHLTSVNVDKIANATGAISIYANSMDLKIQFPNLESAVNISIRNVSSIELPSLKKTEKLLGFYSNYFDTFYAGNLTSTGDLVFVDNSALKNISLPVLETVKGAFQVANNTALNSLTNVPKLKTISGALDLSGNFSQVELPSLNEVGGGLNVQSSGNIDCSKFDKNKVEGKFNCESNKKNPTSSLGGPSSSSSGSSPSQSGSGVRGPVPAGMSMLALIAGAFAL